EATSLQEHVRGHQERAVAVDAQGGGVVAGAYEDARVGRGLLAQPADVGELAAGRRGGRRRCGHVSLQKILRVSRTDPSPPGVTSWGRGRVPNPRRDAPTCPVLHSSAHAGRTPGKTVVNFAYGEIHPPP